MWLKTWLLLEKKALTMKGDSISYQKELLGDAPEPKCSTISDKTGWQCPEPVAGMFDGHYLCVKCAETWLEKNKPKGQFIHFNNTAKP
jgi:hypothetical protein